MSELARAASTRMVEAIMFDMDGTIVEYGIDYDLGRGRALNRIREEIPGARGFRPDARSAREIVLGIAAEMGAEAAEAARRIVFEEYEAVEIEAARRVSPRADAIDTLRELRTCGYRLALVTNNSRRAVGLLLHRFPDLGSEFEVIVTRDDSGELKPGTAGLIMALRALGVRGERAIMVGDTPSDVRAGKRVGALTVGVEGGAARAEDLLGAGADFVVGSVRELGVALRAARGTGPDLAK